MLTRSAVPSRGTDRWLCRSLSREEATLVIDGRRLKCLSALCRAILLRNERLCRCAIAEAGTVGDVSGIGRGPTTCGFCHRRCDTVFNEALSSSATICSRLGESDDESSARKIGLVTKTELLADSWLEEDMREIQKPFLTLKECVLRSAGTGNGGTGPVGG